MLQYMGSRRVRYILGTEQQQAIMNATKNLILHLTGSGPGLFPWEEETMVVMVRTRVLWWNQQLCPALHRNCHLYFSQGKYM